MNVSEKKEGYGYLIDWIIRFGDLFLINLFFIIAYFIFKDSNMFPDLGSIQYREKVFAFLLINLCYFFASTIVRYHISSNIVYLEKIVQRSSGFIAFYTLLLTASFSIFQVIKISVIPWVVGFFILGALLIGWHILFRVLLKSYRRKGFNFRQVVILGGGINGMKLHGSLISSDFGYKVLGYFDDDLEKSQALPDYLGTVNEIFEYIKTEKVDEIFCTLPGSQEDLILELITFCEKNMIRFHLIPEYHKYISRRFTLHFVEATPVLSLRYEPLQHFVNRFTKRAFDILFSGLILVTVFPIIYIVFGIIIKCSSPGPVFFKQKRTGIKGKEFFCYKFRSMRVNADADKKQATANDSRVTKVGLFMRKTSIDELPQFINVFKNDMSVVGPRPHMLQHTDLYSALIEKFMVRHLVKPGITGWAQVTGCRGETRTVAEMEERVKKDVWYLENWTFFLDLKIIFLTVYNAIKGEDNAY
ncbi:MAG: undecaprenyl-phosphate glucose phosphotransferase [Dysgonomonas sp.]|nr:undecaprenyl-phosphate glucose phosphotransferase [Dysgonomonas sp.]